MKVKGSILPKRKYGYLSLLFQSTNLLVDPDPKKKKKKKTYKKALKLELEKETRQNKGVIELFIYFNHFP